MAFEAVQGTCVALCITWFGLKVVPGTHYRDMRQQRRWIVCRLSETVLAVIGALLRYTFKYSLLDSDKINWVVCSKLRYNPATYKPTQNTETYHGAGEKYTPHL